MHKNGNAPQALAGERGAIAKQTSNAEVSVTHIHKPIYPGVFDETALALAMMAVPSAPPPSSPTVDEPGSTLDDDAAAALIAAGFPVEVFDMAVVDGAHVTSWGLGYSEHIHSKALERWADQFRDGLEQIRGQARGADRLVLERVAFYFSDSQFRSATTRPALPTAKEYAAIAERILKEKGDAACYD